jgi:hypothetical protein
MASERDMSLAAAHASRLVSVAGSSHAGIVSLHFFTCRATAEFLVYSF